MYLTLFRSAVALVCLGALTYVFGPVVPFVFLGVALMWGIVHMATKPRAPWMHAGLPVLLLALAVPVIAMAADAAPETVAQATSDSTKVTWAWGAVVAQWADAIGWLILSGVGVAIAKIGGTFGAVLSNSRVQELIKNGVNYGINAVDGAVAGKTLDVNVGNAVLAKALQYALDNSSSWLQTWAGGPLGIAKKIWAALNLGEGVSDDQLQTVVDQVTATNS